MKRTILVFALALFLKPAFGQTYVSGGIFSNTTWTLANSPYIVTDTIVVFPGVTLTIQPGVIVKFDNNKNMDVRGYLNAMGTLNDTIVFTSSSGSPSKGIWNNITIKSDSILFDFIKIEYAHDGIINLTYNNNGHSKIYHSRFSQNENAISYIGSSSSTDSSYVLMCLFDSNTTAIQSIEESSLIKNCTFTNNNIGIGYIWATTLLNCVFTGHTDKAIVGYGADYIGNTITNNNIGMNVKLYNNCCELKNNIITNNNIGVQVRGDITSTPNTGFYNNTICNNTTYNVENTDAIDLVLTNNCWCTNDSATIASLIYDAYDNLSLGVISFVPYLTNCSLGIKNVKNENAISLFPNPVTNKFIISFNSIIKIGTIEILNTFGESLFEKSIVNESKKEINLNNISSGIYFVKVFDGEKSYCKKLIVE